MSAITVTADDARARGLAPVAFSVDVTGSALIVTPFPESDKYLIASGPPGGPLLAIAWSADERATHLGAIEYEVRRHHAKPWQQPLSIGEPGTLILGGVERTALAFTTGQGMRITAWCAVLVPSLGSSMLVALGRGSPRPLSCAEVLADPNLAAFARGFAVAA